MQAALNTSRYASTRLHGEYIRSACRASPQWTQGGARGLPRAELPFALPRSNGSPAARGESFLAEREKALAGKGKERAGSQKPVVAVAGVTTETLRVALLQRELLPKFRTAKA